MNTLDDAVETLRRLGCRPSKSGDEWTAFCPVHEADGSGHSPSLTLKSGDTVPVVVKCHAGCPQAEVLKALGIASEPLPKGGKRLVATYRYLDPTGREIRQKRRYEPKTFSIHSPTATGEWINKAGPGPAVLYRLPEVSRAIQTGTPIYVCEGEKDADRLAALGLVTTTNIEGAAQPTQRPKWKAEYIAQLTGAACVILLPDNDEPGRAHMANIAQQLRGKVGKLHWLELPDLPPKGDVSDWMNAGHTAAELEALAANAPEPPSEAARKATASPSDSPKTLAGVVDLLSQPPWVGVVGFNAFKQRIEKRKAPPYADGEPGPWLDHDTAESMIWFEQETGVAFSRDLIDLAVLAVAHRNRFNPAQERLHKLAKQWDGVKRLECWLPDYLSAKATDSNREYLEEIGAAWLKGVCARVLIPGCKRDDVLVLRSEQGWRKSTAAQAIADAIHTEAFTDSVDLGNLAEAKIQIRGVIIAELSELAGMARGEVEGIKAFVATKSDHFREKFGRYANDFPRTVSFIGTTNDPNYLKDPTGNRRWWPVTLDAPIDIPKLQGALPQLIGEAAQRVLKGEIWHVNDAKALEQAEHIRAAHYDEDPWTDAVMRYVTSISTGLEALEHTITTSAILDNGLAIPRVYQTPGAQRRVAAILRTNGYEEKRSRLVKGINPRRYWKKKEIPIHVLDVAHPAHPAHNCFSTEKTVPDACRINELSGTEKPNNSPSVPDKTLSVTYQARPEASQTEAVPHVPDVPDSPYISQRDDACDDGEEI